MEKNESRRAKMSKTLIKTALLELMAEKPFSKISVKELCEQADVNRSTFYAHYYEQSDVLREIEQETIDEILSSLQDVYENAEPLEQVIAFLEYVKANAPLFRILLVQEESKHFRPMFIEASLGELRSEIEYKGDKKYEPFLLSFMMNAEVQIYIDWIESDFALPSSEIAKLILALWNNVWNIKID